MFKANQQKNIFKYDTHIPRTVLKLLTIKRLKITKVHFHFFQSFSYDGDLRDVRVPGQGVGPELHEGSARQEPEDISHLVQRIPGRSQHLHLRSGLPVFSCLLLLKSE
jgi:hypothetical protein